RLLDRPPDARFLFFFIGTAPTQIYTLSLHDALPIFQIDAHAQQAVIADLQSTNGTFVHDSRVTKAVALSDGDLIKIGPIELTFRDRKSTRLNSSHVAISYAVFCLQTKIREYEHSHHD